MEKEKRSTPDSFCKVCHKPIINGRCECLPKTLRKTRKGSKYGTEKFEIRFLINEIDGKPVIRIFDLQSGKDITGNYPIWSDDPDKCAHALGDTVLRNRVYVRRYEVKRLKV